MHPLAVLRRRLATPSGAVRLASAGRRDRAALGDLARERGAALVHSNTSVILSGGPVARRSGVRHLVHVREIYPGAGGRAGGLLWPLMRRRLLRADALACISPAVREQFGGSPRARLVPDGLPRVPSPESRAAARARLGLPDDRFVVGFVGRLSDWKGQDVLARALALPPLADLGGMAIVAGDEMPGTGHRAELDRLAAELGVEDRLLRLGFVTDIDVVLGAADALAVPSTRPEPLGLVALEAAAASVPVVASDAGGVAELVRGGGGGRLVPPGDPVALASALRALADDPAAARALGAAGAEHVAREHTAERMLGELQALYDELAG